MFLTLDDLEGTLEVVRFQDVCQMAKPFVNLAMPMLITGIMEKDAERGRNPS